MYWIIIFFILCFPLNSFAAETYWVSPTGAAADMASCSGSTPLSGTDACTRTKAMAFALQPGDVVYFRAGTYTVASSGLDYEGIKLAAKCGGGSDPCNGSSGNPIIFSSYNDEEVIIDGGAYSYGIALTSRDYVKIDGITFRNIASWGHVSGSDYVEITNCTFGPATTEVSQTGLGISNGSTHAWIHGNTFEAALSPSGACAEGSDLLRIGSGYAIGKVDPGNNYHTIEDNVFAHAAHTNFDNYGMYNIVRNNVSHNEPWITGCTTGQSGKEPKYDTSETSLALGTGSKSLTVSTGKTYRAGSPIGIISTASPQNAMSGTVSSYNSGTGALVVNVTYSTGSGTISSWTISKGNYPYYETASYNDKYGHRNFQVSDDYARDGLFNLYEGNRLGHASNNPGNGGPMGFDVAGPKNLVRYNAIYNGMSAGIYFKYAHSSLTSPITSTSSVEIGEGEKTFTIASGLVIYDGQTLRIWNVADKTKAMTGTVASYNEGTGELVANITATNGSGTLDAWQVFWNGASGGINNRIYNNTLYHNGEGYDWRAYGNMNVAYSGVGICQANSAGIGSTSNVIKNNIVYDNKEGAICSIRLYDGDSTTTQCSARDWDTISNNLSGGTGDLPTNDPLFVNPDLTDPTSTTLPNLSLQSSSPAIDGGTFLTLANGAGDNNATIHVDDALYFQDGTWGSSLSNIQADWIAIGTVTNVVQISSIDYQTNTITLAEAKTWADDAPIWLYKKSDGERVLYGSAPDYGAYEYDPGAAPQVTGSFGGILH